MKKDPVLTVFLAWILPGAGHWYVGQRWKAVLFCFFVVLLFTLGVLLTDGGCVDLTRHRYAAILQAADGIPMLIAAIATKGASEPAASKTNDFGMLLTLVAGALNVLIISDALYRTSPDAEGARIE